MVCKRCGTEFDGAFCPNCGERAEAKMTVCPVCGKERAEGENFCAKCGYAFEGQATATQKPQAKITFDKEALIGGVRKFYKVALNIGKVFFSLLLFLILASPIMLHEGINTAGNGYTNAFNLYVDGRFTAVCAILMIIAFYSLIYGVYACVKFFVFRNREESKASKIIYFAANFLVFTVCCIGCSGAGDWFADAGAGLSFGIFVGIVGMALSVLRYLFEDKFVGSDGSQSVEVSDDVKAVEKKATKKVKLGTAVVTGALVIAVVITSIVQSVYTNPFSSASYGFAETRADVVKQFGMPENAKEDSSSYTYYSTEYAAAERMIDALIAAQDKQLTDGFESDADSFDEDDFESMFDGVAGIDGIIEKLEEKQDNIKYKKSVVTFNNDGGENRNNDTIKSFVCEIVTPAVEGEEKTERTLKKIDVIEGVYEEYGYSAQIKYVAKYSDGSFSGDILTLNSDNYDKNKKEYNFSDALGEYSVSISEFNKIQFDYFDGTAVIGNTLYISKSFDKGDWKVNPEGEFSNDEITKIVILQGVTTVSSEGAFDDFPNVNEIIVPDSLIYLNPNTIRNTAFYNDSSNWEDGSVLYIGNLLVEVKDDINEDYTVRSGTTAINENAFSGMTNLKSITIPDSVTSIGGYAFSGCSSLTSITIPDSVTRIGENAFKDCKIINANIPAFALDYISTSELKTVIINSGNRIGDDAFRNCSSLTSITIPDSVTSIGDGAFYNCSSLTSITIPDSVTSIGSYAFYNCSSLTELNYNAVNVADFTSSSNVFENAGKNTDGIKVVFGESVERIPAYLFYYVGGDSSYRPKIISVTIGNDVTSIGTAAFYGCSSLTSVNFGENSQLESIGSSAFSNCSSLTSITIPDSVTSIDDWAFSNCSSLTSVNFGENSQLERIGDWAFRDCRSLTSITIPDSVKSIGSDAFSDCSSLTSVNFGENSQLERIGGWAFYNCSSLTSISIPYSVTSIGSYAFSRCSSLTSVIFENTQGWWYSDSSSATSGTNISSSDLADPATAAQYLTDTYLKYYWKRG